jgi:high-affinity Fe2+/Pb2+ permease
MKPSLQANVLVLIGAGCMFASLFQKPLGLPDWTGFVLPVLGALLVWCGVWLLRRAKKRGDTSIVPPTPQQYQKRMRLSLVLVVLASLTSPFYLPYTGVTLPFPQLVICALVSCGVGVTLVLVSMRRYRPRPNQAMQRTAGRLENYKCEIRK